MTISDLIPWNRREKSQVPVRAEGQDPFRALSGGVDEWFDRFFGGFGLAPFESGGQWDVFTPRMNVVERDEEIEVSVELPGMDEKDVEVTLSRDELTISGEKHAEKEHESKGHHRVERSYGSFRRSISLPRTVDVDGAEASFEKGVLTITLPTSAEARDRRRIPVKSG